MGFMMIDWVMFAARGLKNHTQAPPDSREPTRIQAQSQIPARPGTSRHGGCIVARQTQHREAQGHEAMGRAQMIIPKTEVG
jgi:hypothetical protein